MLSRVLWKHFYLLYENIWLSQSCVRWCQVLIYFFFLSFPVPRAVTGTRACAAHVCRQVCFRRWTLGSGSAGHKKMYLLGIPMERICMDTIILLKTFDMCTFDMCGLLVLVAANHCFCCYFVSDNLCRLTWE